MTFSVRDLVYIGVFAGCWGAIEITVGGVVHALRVPFGGTMLTGAGIAIALVGSQYVPRRGAVALIALITALLKMLSVGGIVLSPMIAITLEGLVAEACLAAVGSTLPGFLCAGAMACLYPLLHATMSAWITGGTDFLGAYVRILERGANLLGVPVSWGLGLLALIAAIHVAIGLVSGTLAWRIGAGLQRRGRHAG
jgi:hypothetical protein